MSDDFFDDIDAELNKQKSVNAAKNDSSEANRAFVRDVIPRLAAIAQTYAAKCRDRGMSADVSHSEYSITFTLQYKSGEKRSLIGHPHHDMGNKLGFEDHFPNDDGKRYKSMPMAWHDEKSWSDDRYEALLKKTIRDFVFYADRFGGV